jgi:hypothetical protein
MGNVFNIYVLYMSSLHELSAEEPNINNTVSTNIDLLYAITKKLMLFSVTSEIGYIKNHRL